MDRTVDNDSVWNAIIAREGRIFTTHRGKAFSYHIKKEKSGELQSVMVIDSNKITITRSTVLLAFHQALDVQKKHGFVKGPGKLGAHGAVYLYPIFLDIGICTDNKAAQPAQDICPQPETQASAETNCCKYCGYPLDAEFAFCPKCGRIVLRADNQQEETPAQNREGMGNKDL